MLSKESDYFLTTFVTRQSVGICWHLIRKNIKFFIAISGSNELVQRLTSRLTAITKLILTTL